MVVGKSVKRVARGAAVTAAAVIAVLFLTQNPAKAVSGGEAAAIGLGSFALGSALGAGAANPYGGGYYGGYAYPYGGYYPAPAAPAYYPPPTPYYGPRSCWDSYYRRYYAC
jgi:hypothetical protein